MKNISNFKIRYHNIFVLFIILNLIFQFTFLIFSTKTVLAQDYYSILQNIIDTDDESQLLSIVEKWQKTNDEISPLFIGIAYHNLALIDSEKYSKLAVEWLEKYKGAKFTSICMAYKGSAITLIGNALAKKKDFIGASARLNEGFKLIDKAVNLDPENIIIRFLRSENGMEITESTPFNRSKEVEQDLNFLSTKLTSFSPLSRAQYYLLLGRLKIYQKKIAEAIAALKMVIKEAPDSKYAKKARQLLAKLED